MSKPKIYITVVQTGSSTRTEAFATTQDGEVLIDHQPFPSLPQTLRGMGLTGGHMHDIYAKRYPEGYDLEFVAEPARHDGYQAAIKHTPIDAARQALVDHVNTVASRMRS